MKELKVFSDGSLDFGNGIIGPSSADVYLANGKLESRKARSSKSLQAGRSSELLLFSRMPRRMRRPLFAGMSLVGLGLAACGGSSVSSDDSSENQNNAGVNQALRIPLEDLRDVSAPIYYTGGPHFDGLTGSVRAGVDFSGKDQRSCPGNSPSENIAAVAARNGKVTIVGNEKDKSDKNHSLIEVDHGEGLSLGYMHLANINVKDGQEIKAGDILGFISCEVSPGGATSGQHLHLYAKRDGKFAPIVGFEFSGWKIEESRDNYQGTASKQGQTIRTADVGRCGPDTASIRACGGVRNDLLDDLGVSVIVGGSGSSSNNQGEITGAVIPGKVDEKTPEPPTPTPTLATTPTRTSLVPTFTSTSSVTRTPIPTPTLTPKIETSACLPLANTWRDITPGISTKQDLLTKLGTPTKIENVGGRETLYFASTNQFRPHSVVVEQGKVILIKEEVIATERGKLADYKGRYGEPERQLWGQYSSAVSLNFWGCRGLGVWANINDGTIFGIWYFEASDYQRMLSRNFGLSLNQTPQR